MSESNPKTYVGIRDDSGARVEVVVGDCALPLQHVVLHSPDSFEWGYAGSGPADLALSILANALGERPTAADLYNGCFQCTTCHGEGHLEGVNKVCPMCKGAGNLGPVKCQRLHQPYKFEVVAYLARDSWEITEAAVLEWFAGKMPDDVARDRFTDELVAGLEGEVTP